MISYVGDVASSWWCVDRPSSCEVGTCSCDYGSAAVDYVENEEQVNNCTSAVVSTACDSDGDIEVATVSCQRSSI